MTNYEHYKDEILNAVEKSRFNLWCYNHVEKYKKITPTILRAKIFMDWCNEEYKEPNIDWTLVTVDTPILVSGDNNTWKKRYFAKYEDGKVYAWDQGKTSWSVGSNYETSKWTYAKLVTVE